MNQEQLNQALRQACRDGNLGKVKEYLEKGANVNTTDERGDTPLHLAVIWKYTVIAKLLLEKGADIEATDERGDTPLHCAAWHGHTEGVKMLIEAGANPKTKSKNGRIPLDCVYVEIREKYIEIEEEYSEIVKALGGSVKDAITRST